MVIPNLVSVGLLWRGGGRGSTGAVGLGPTVRSNAKSEVTEAGRIGSEPEGVIDSDGSDILGWDRLTLAAAVRETMNRPRRRDRLR